MGEPENNSRDWKKGPARRVRIARSDFVKSIQRKFTGMWIADSGGVRRGNEVILTIRHRMGHFVSPCSRAASRREFFAACQIEIADLLKLRSAERRAILCQRKREKVDPLYRFLRRYYRASGDCDRSPSGRRFSTIRLQVPERPCE